MLKHIFYLVIIVWICFSNNAYSQYLLYNVKKGDTFYSLSRKFNVDIWLIQKENNITTLKEGETIKIPIRIFNSYVVQKGDTLFSLSKKFNTTIEEIISVNNLDSIDIKVGQTLTIPISKNPLKHNTSKKLIPNRTENIYVVQKGDTLFSISRKIGVDIKEILKINNLNKESIIKPGMIIILSKSLSLTTHSTKTKKFKENHNNDNIKISFQLPISFATYIKNQSSRFLEIVTSRKDNVKAIMDGEVIFVGSFSIFGKTVIIKHSENLYSIYGMFDDISIQKGMKVKKGDIIGSPSFDSINNGYVVKFSFIINDKMIIPQNKI
ncbi:MAG: LysM peptidoglycan-binding domain-containing protein [Brevinematales bacterium]|nr:LysM peptidoglycan-binding domain-containing protein [Brevinematales bacterium]